MVKHHLMKVEELKHQCFYCDKGVSGLDSEWSSKFHYKTIKCSCGKKHWIKVNWHGSGHDNWEEEIKLALKYAEEADIKMKSVEKGFEEKVEKEHKKVERKERVGKHREIEEKGKVEKHKLLKE